MKNRLKKLIVNNNLISLVSTIFYVALTGLSFLFVVRTYSKEILGQWIIYTTGLGFIEMVRAGFIFTALIKFLSGSKTDEEKKMIIGSSWAVTLLSTIIMTVILYILFYIFKDIFIKKGFLLFFKLFPLTFIGLLPITISFPILTSKQKFDKLLLIKNFMILPSVVFLFFNYLIFKLDITTVSAICVLAALPTMLFCLVSGMSGIQYLFKLSKSFFLKLFNFGKYSMLTTIGSSCLRVSDIYIIGLFLTNIEVAVYGIPLKIINIFEQGLNSFCDVAMPAMSKEAGDNNFLKIKKIYYKYSTIITLLLIPVIIVFALFSKQVIWLIGGTKYTNSKEIYYVLYIFLITFVMQPFERFTGVALDSINKPRINFVKVLIMALVNIIGDIVAVIIFKSIVVVALVTTLNVLVGVIIGSVYLNLQINTTFNEFFGFIKSEIITYYRKILSFKNT